MRVCRSCGKRVVMMLLEARQLIMRPWHVRLLPKGNFIPGDGSTDDRSTNRIEEDQVFTTPTYDTYIR